VKHVRQRLTYANVMSSLAVFLILGGATAFAATKIGTKELKAGAVTTGKIKKEAVSTAKLKKNAVTTPKIAKDAVTGEKVAESTLGQVPSAANAALAENANHVNGQSASKLFKTMSEGQTNVPVATVAGFSIAATCGTNDVDITVSPPNGPGTVLIAGGVPANSTKTTFSYASNKPGEASNTIKVDQLSDGSGDATFGVSSLDLATDTGTVVSGTIGYDWNTFNNVPPDTCVVYGQLLVG
jgi:hypothetical protein